MKRIFVFNNLRIIPTLVISASFLSFTGFANAQTLNLTPVPTSSETGVTNVTDASTAGILPAATTTATTTASTATTTQTNTGLHAYLASSWQDGYIVYPGQPTAFHAQFINPENSPVLIDMELFNQDGKQISQKSWDNVTLPQTFNPNSSVLTGTSTPPETGGVGTSTATSTTGTSTDALLEAMGVYSLRAPQNLTSGVYTWKAALFHPGWKNMIQWYDNPQSFTVVGTTTGTSSMTIILGGTWQPQKTISNGSFDYLTLNLVDGNKTSTAYIEADLFDSNNNLITTNSWDYVTLNPLDNLPEYVVSPVLSPGTYHWSVGIFSPQRKKLYSWYDNVQTFTVNPAP